MPDFSRMPLIPMKDFPRGWNAHFLTIREKVFSAKSQRHTSKRKNPDIKDIRHRIIFEVHNVLVDFRLSWGTNETLCTSSLNSWWRLPRVEEPTLRLLCCRESRFRKVAATKYLVRRYSQSYWFPKIT